MGSDDPAFRSWAPDSSMITSNKLRISEYESNSSFIDLFRVHDLPEQLIDIDERGKYASGNMPVAVVTESTLSFIWISLTPAQVSAHYILPARLPAMALKEEAESGCGSGCRLVQRDKGDGHEQLDNVNAAAVTVLLIQHGCWQGDGGAVLAGHAERCQATPDSRSDIAAAEQETVYTV